MCDLESYERDFNFKILPDVARIDKNISVFSEKEAKADSIANSKFNKKFRKKIYEQLHPKEKGTSRSKSKVEKSGS